MRNAVGKRPVGRPKSLEHFMCLVRSAGDVVVWTVGVLDRETIWLFRSTIDAYRRLTNDSWGMHLDPLCMEVEIDAVILEESYETCSKVVRLGYVLDIADDQTDDTEASEATGVDFVVSTHDKELLHKSNHVDHIWIVTLPPLECSLGLDTTQVLERDIDMDVGQTVHKLDDGDLCFGDAQDVGRHSHSLKPPGRFPEGRVDHAPRGKIHDLWATIVVFVRCVDKIHISSRQIQASRKRPKAEYAANLMGKPLRAESFLDPIN